MRNWSFRLTPGDGEFREVVPEATSKNEQVDNYLLYAVYNGQVEFSSHRRPRHS